ncbi:MAG TPA: hypothetical protein VGM87_15200 [Roseomonas sp.]|jgi:hypothetical protein
MAAVTLILTRMPLDEFVLVGDQNVDVDELTEEERLRLYLPRHAPVTARPSVKRKSGRWGAMLMVTGPKVTAASFASPGAAGSVALAGRMLSLATDGGGAVRTREYTTLERYRGSFGSLEQSERFVMMPAREDPYPLEVERGNRVVKTLRKGHSGDCIRVRGGETKAQRGILIHEAPNVGWVIGCIGPRPKGNKRVFSNEDGNPSFVAMKQILDEMTAFGHGRGQLFVLP